MDPKNDSVRVIKLIDTAIARLELNLSGLTILTEAASGVFAVTPLIAARAGAARVIAVTRDSRFGQSDDVIENICDLALKMGVGDKIHCSTLSAFEFADQADIVTNLGFVRPLNHNLLKRLPKHSVIPLMWEPWEFRQEDVDILVCRERQIAVIGTCETDPRLRIFDYLGAVVAKLLFESGLEVLRTRVALIASDPFGEAIERVLTQMGVEVTRLSLPKGDENLDARWADELRDVDALVVAEQKDKRCLVGGGNGICTGRLHAQNIRLVHLSGVVDDDDLCRAGVPKFPEQRVEFGRMTVTTGYVGPRPVIDLHAGGLRAAELAVRARLNGASVDEAEQVAVDAGIGLRLNLGDCA